jgi:hypothetical protein
VPDAGGVLRDPEPATVIGPDDRVLVARAGVTAGCEVSLP